MYLDNQKYSKSRILVTDDMNGEILMDKEVEFPIHFSEQARKIVTYKYFQEYETSFRQVVTRVVDWYHQKLIETYGEKIKLIKNKIPFITSAHDFAQYLYNNIMEQNFSFNSPVWFNLGVPHKKPQVSACYINSVEDSLESILLLNVDEGLIFNGGSGAGVNMSAIRGKGEPITGGGVSSGVLSWMRPSDSFGGSIKSGGKTRRSAKINILDEDHLDIVDFIECKTKQEEIAQVLKDAGYDASFNGEIYTKIIAYQNANHSVRLSDNTMSGNDVAIKNKKGETVNTIPSEDMLDLISLHAWKGGEPGIQFRDKINAMHTCKNDGEIRGSNPCSEYFFLDDTACNLASINLKNVNPYFDNQKFIDLVNVLILAMDLSVDSYHPTTLISETNPEYRTLGLGITNYGAYIMSLGIPYGSDMGNERLEEITKTLTYNAYLMSSHIAEWLSPFPRYKFNEDSMLKVILKMFPEEERRPNLIQRMSLHGIRNAQVSVIAPTGTISFMMDADTFGIEPLVALKYNKTLAGGGEMVSVPFKCVQELQKLAEMDEDDFNHTALETALGENSIEPIYHLKALSSAQKYITGGISKTINLPNSATPNDIKEIIKLAWDMNIKSLSVYRDKSKGIQPINVDDGDEDVQQCDNCYSKFLVPDGTCMLCTDCGRKMGGC